MTEIMFFVPGVPVPKKRPRVMKTGITFTPKETEVYENLVRMAFKQKYPAREPASENLHLCMTFAFPIPASAKRKKQPDKIKEGDYFFHRPDLDNLVKTVLDALNHVAFADDSQVVMMDGRKVYGTVPGAYITLKEVLPALPFGEEGVES